MQTPHHKIINLTMIAVTLEKRKKYVSLWPDLEHDNPVQDIPAFDDVL